MKLILQTSLLTGTIIGAGVFSLPFVFSQSGFLLGLFLLVIAAIATILTLLMYADLALRTKGEHRFIGFADIYLGKGVRWLTILMTIVEMLLVLTIYLILSASFSSLFLSAGSELEKILIFWFIGSFAVFLTLRRVAFLEFLITGGIIAVIGIVFVLSFSNIEIAKFSTFNISNFLLPLAPLIFAFSGRVAIPSLVMYSREKVKRAVIAGVAVPAVIYIVFIASVLALSPTVSQDAVNGLVGVLPKGAILLIGVLGILSLFSSYITIGVDIRRSLLVDLKLPAGLRALIVAGAPLGFYFMGFKSFIGLVDFVGGIFLALEGLMIAAMWIRAKKISNYPSQLLKNRGCVSVWFVVIVFGTVLIHEMSRLLI